MVLEEPPVFVLATDHIAQPENQEQIAVDAPRRGVAQIGPVAGSAVLRGQRALLNCAPIGEERLADRAMRAAVSRANGSTDFVNQQSFDRAVAEIVRLIPIPPETSEWFSEKDFVVGSRWTWKKMMRNPAVLATSIAVVVIAGVFVFQLLTSLNEFPGSATARRLLTVAASTRPPRLRTKAQTTKRPNPVPFRARTPSAGTR